MLKQARVLFILFFLLSPSGDLEFLSEYFEPT